MTSAKIQPIINFFGANVQTSSQFSVALKPINLKILPAGAIYSTSHPRKWIQIQIWTHGPIFNPFQILSPTAASQTLKMKISRTPYYSPSWDVPILLYESLKTLKWPKNKSENLNRGCRTSKNDFCENSADHQFFWRRCANFVSVFGRLKTYKPENPSGWHYLLDEPSPEMDSNLNLNGWTSI